MWGLHAIGLVLALGPPVAVPAEPTIVGG